MKSYAKVVVKGTPISKSNFKMVNKDGRSFMPSNTGKYHDRYANYEEEIALTARSQNPGVVMDDALIAVLKVFYKSQKRHPDTNNITKSIFDGIEKSGLIVNDSQITRLVIEEYYDKENPRFELELFQDSVFNLTYTVLKRETPLDRRLYELPSNRKGQLLKKSAPSAAGTTPTKKSAPPAAAVVPVKSASICSICGTNLKGKDFIKADGGKTLICRGCFNKLF